MEVYSINNEPSQVYLSNSHLIADKIRESNQTKIEYEKKNDPGSLSKDRKSSIVSEKIDEPQLNTQTDLRFQQGSPVSKLLNIIKSFNETKKIFNSQLDGGYSIPKTASQKKEETIHNGAPIGFYIVVDEEEKTNKQKAIKGRFNMIKEKIAETYNLGFKKDKGSLVNLTA